MKLIKNQSGFILLELLLALAILGLGIADFFSLFINAFQGPLLSLDRTQAFFSSQETLIAVQSEKNLSPGIYKAGIDQEGNWRLIPQRGLAGHFLLAGDSQDSGPAKNQTSARKLSFDFDRKFQRFGAGKFDGQASYLKTKDAFSLKGKGPLTISVWIKKIGPQRAPIAGRYNLLKDEGSYILYQDQDLYIFKIAGPEGQDSISATSTPSAWEHLVGVFDPGGPFLHFYLNGQLKNSKKTNITSLNQALEIEFFVGTDSSLSQFFEGEIFDLRVYNRSLTSKEISALYGSYSRKGEKYLEIKETKEKPLGLWSFNEGEGCLSHDESGNDNQIIFKPDCPTLSPIWESDLDGNEKSSLFFQGNSFAQVEDKPSLRIKNQITISLWLKILDLENNSFLLQKRAKTSEDYSFAIVYDGLKKGFGFGLARGNPETLEAVFSPQTVLAGKWQHLLVTFDGQNKKIYLDNQEMTNLEIGQIDNLGESSDFYLGQSSQGLFRFKGNLDEIRIFDKVLSDSDKKALFSRERFIF